MSPDDSHQTTRSLKSDCKTLQSVMESMLLKIFVSSAQQATLDINDLTFNCSSPVPDEDLEIRGGSPKNFFSSLLASVWSKNKGAGPSPGFATGHICVFNTGGFVLDCHALCLQDFISNRIYWSTNWNSLFIFVVVSDVFLFFILTSSLMFPLRHRFARCSFFASYCL